jgi:hypothetical protein
MPPCRLSRAGGVQATATPDQRSERTTSSGGDVANGRAQVPLRLVQVPNATSRAQDVPPWPALIPGPSQSSCLVILNTNRRPSPPIILPDLPSPAICLFRPKPAFLTRFYCLSACSDSPSAYKGVAPSSALHRAQRRPQNPPSCLQWPCCPSAATTMLMTPMMLLRI